MLRAAILVTRVLVEDRMVEISMMRFSRSLATTSSVVLYSSWVLSPQETLIQRPSSSGLRRAGSALGQSARWTDTP